MSLLPELGSISHENTQENLWKQVTQEKKNCYNIDVKRALDFRNYMGKILVEFLTIPSEKNPLNKRDPFIQIRYL